MMVLKSGNRIAAHMTSIGRLAVCPEQHLTASSSNKSEIKAFMSVADALANAD
jgi:hypothetical protein